MRALILGATGTLGTAMTTALLKRPDVELIRAVSRDELKLSEFKNKFSDERVETFIGDIRDKKSIADAFEDIDTCFHFAALKRIPEMEAQPLESLRTNVLGTVNAAELALEHGVENFIFSSTDKACRPINAYGASKFLSERILISLNKKDLTNFSVYRWVNVLASRGAVVYAFKDAIENSRPAFITDPRMTRGWIKIEDAVDFVLKTYKTKSDEIKIPEIKCAPVLKMLGAIGTALGKIPAYVVTGMRNGEKIHEDISFDLKTNLCVNTENADQYTEEELIAIAKEIVK